MSPNVGWLSHQNSRRPQRRRREIEHRAGRHDTGGVHPTVALVIMVLDVEQIHRLPHARPLIQIARMRTALNEMVIAGIKCNIPLCLDIINDAAFAAGGQNIHYLEQKLGLKH